MTDETTPPPRPGRPTLAPEERRTDRLPDIRVTTAEREAAAAKAAAAGLSLTEFCRRAIAGQRVSRRATRAAETDAAARLALNRIGVLLNQIARRANASGRVPPHLDAVLDQVSAAIERLASPSDGA